MVSLEVDLDRASRVSSLLHKVVGVLKALLIVCVVVDRDSVSVIIEKGDRVDPGVDSMRQVLQGLCMGPAPLNLDCTKLLAAPRACRNDDVGCDLGSRRMGMLLLLLLLLVLLVLLMHVGLLLLMHMDLVLLLLRTTSGLGFREPHILMGADWRTETGCCWQCWKECMGGMGPRVTRGGQAEVGLTWASIDCGAACCCCIMPGWCPGGMSPNGSIAKSGRLGHYATGFTVCARQLLPAASALQPPPCAAVAVAQRHLRRLVF